MRINWFAKRSLDGPVVVRGAKIRYVVTNGSSRKVDQKEYVARINWQERTRA